MRCSSTHAPRRQRLGLFERRRSASDPRRLCGNKIPHVPAPTIVSDTFARMSRHVRQCSCLAGAAHSATSRNYRSMT